MAVTQQLASVTTAHLELCRRSADFLDKVCSFEVGSRADYLDLGWAPSLLEKSVALANVPQDLVDALKSATEGGPEVNPEYRNHPETIFEHPVTALDAEQVRRVAGSLSIVANRELFSEHRVPPLDLSSIVASRSLTHPHQYLDEHLSALVRFYERAAGKGLAIIMWWD